MGTITSRDTRRISFDNNFALSPALAISKSIDDENLLALNPIAPEKNSQLIFPEPNKITELQEDREVDYWAQRIENLKKEHQIINKIMETEYEKTIAKTNKVLEIPKPTDYDQKFKPCIELRAKMMKCYEENERQPLVCSPVVKAFSQCVATSRLSD